jgi:hypothetical protein
MCHYSETMLLRLETEAVSRKNKNEDVKEALYIR